jgi:hypothetical protein
MLQRIDHVWSFASPISLGDHAQPFPLSGKVAGMKDEIAGGKMCRLRSGCESAG